MRVELAVSHPVGEEAKVAGERIGCIKHLESSYTDEGIGVDVADVEGRRLIGAVAERDQCALGIQSGQQAGKGAAANRLENQVEATADVIGGRDHPAGAQPGQGSGPPAANERSHVSTTEVCELYGEATYAARGAGDEHSAAQDRRPEPERAQRGKTGRRKCRRLRERDAIG